MITIEKTFDLQLNYDLSRIGDPERILFFDIETTGLTAYGSALYLIGAVHFRDGVCLFRQWFCESLSQEMPVLNAFFDYCKDFDTLLHFNGDTFDIRYLEGLAEQYGLATPFSRMQSVDILKLVRKRKKILGLTSCRQKSIEKFLGIDREDVFSGGELIPVYDEFQKTGSEKLLKLLLLHNEEDLLGMPEILPVLNYVDCFMERADFTVKEVFRNRSGSKFYAVLDTGAVYPVPCEYTNSDGFTVHFEKDELIVTVPLFTGELKYFYPNYHEYYYLPAEDRAIHKKVAQFVEPDHRENCKPENCYQKLDSFFLPAVKGTDFPIFVSEYKSRNHYVRYQKNMLEEYIKKALAQF